MDRPNPTHQSSISNSQQIPEQIEKAHIISTSDVSTRIEAELTEPQQNLLRLVRLIVDIEYKRKYGHALDKDSAYE